MDQDHIEYRVFGPPGTGKTTYLADHIQKAAGKFGGSQVIACSFTKTAAREIASRGLELPPKNIGTVHHFALAAIGGGAKIVNATFRGEWNKDHPNWRLSDAKETIDNPTPEPLKATFADTIHAATEVRRNRLDPVETWPAQCRSFHAEWTEWKEANGLMDFTDLLERAYHDSDAAPGKPAVAFVDEVQDLTPLQLALIRKWAQGMSHVVLSGDDDQCIYAWAGATEDAFLNPPLADEFKRVLKQSYRVPACVHRLSQTWIKQVKRREPKEYLPREEEGEIRRVPWQHTRQLGQMVDEIEERIDSGLKVMILASCAYMLDSAIKELRARAIPFHNPYRVSDARWNPLLPGSSKKVMAVDRVLAFLRPSTYTWGAESGPWTLHDCWCWMSQLAARGLLAHGAKETIAKLKGNVNKISDRAFLDLFQPDRQEESGNIHFVSAEAEKEALTWLVANATGEARKRLEYPALVARTHGGLALVNEPSVVVGTIHSTKGAQSDCVYLFPDLSKQGFREWSNHATRDHVIRQFYVGMTRAKSELNLCQQASPLAVPLQAFAATQAA